MDMTKLFPARLIESHKKMGRTDWMVFENGEWQLNKKYYKDNPKIYNKYKNKAHTMIYHYFMSKILVYGPKVMQTSQELIIETSQIELGFSFEDYHQPYDYMIFQFYAPYEGKNEEHYAITYQEPKTKSIFMFLSRDLRIHHFYFTPINKDIIIQELVDEANEEYMRFYIQAFLNINMLAVSYGLRHKGWTEGHEKRKRKRPELAIRDFEFVELAQQISFKPSTSGESLGGTHASPRPHWRRGHEKMIPCGPRHSERKKIFIPMTFVNGLPQTDLSKTSVAIDGSGLP